MKIKVVQFSNIDDEVSQLSKEINSRYCELNNYDYEFENFNYEPLKCQSIIELAEKSDDNDNKANINAITSHKYEIILKDLKKYDYICWIDVDACFNNPYRKIEDLIDEKHELFLSKDSGLIAPTIFTINSAIIIQKFLNENKLNYIPDFQFFSKKIKELTKFDILAKMQSTVFNPLGLNTGFMIFRNSNESEIFLEDCKKYHPLFSAGFYDQDCISFLLQKKKYKDICKILDNKLQGNYALKSQPEFAYNEDENFILHNYGQPNKVRIASMKYVKQNKWWKGKFDV